MILIVALACPCSYGQVANLSKAYGATVQSFKQTKEVFRLQKSSRFYIVEPDEATQEQGKDGAGIVKASSKVKSTVRFVASEFAKKKKPSSKTLKVISGTRDKSKNGDILIEMHKGKYQAQQYQLTVGPKVVIKASTADGVFYGLRSLLKYRIATGSNTLKGAVIKDKPDVKERVVHLDCARKYYSKSWIQKFIRRASWQGYNAIEIHFSEDQGLRLKSKKFPWLAGTYNGVKGVLTQSQMAEICSTARNNHVDVIPSFDSPGHMDYITKRYRSYVSSHPNFKFKYKGKTYSKNSSGFSNISNYFKYNGAKSAYNYCSINLANPVARAFTAALIDEYADFFKKQGCSKFNIGGDELHGWYDVTVGGRTFTHGTKWKALQHWESYARHTLKISKGSPADTYIDYMNKTATRLEKKGYTCRMWNDEMYRCGSRHIKIKKSIKIVFWTDNYAPLSKFKSKGYDLYNAVSTWTYYVTTPPSVHTYKYVYARPIYERWNPKSFAEPGYKAKTISDAHYQGAYFCIWCDYASAKTQSQVYSDAGMKMWASGAKMWNRQVHSKYSGIGKTLSYNTFKKYVKRF